MFQHYFYIYSSHFFLHSNSTVEEIQAIILDKLCDLAVYAGGWLKAKETETSAIIWVHVRGERMLGIPWEWE